MGERASESGPGLLDESKGTETCTDTEGGTGVMALNLRVLQVQRLRFESKYPHSSPHCFFHSSSKGPDTLSWPLQAPSMQVVHRQTWGQSTQTHKMKNE